MPREFLLKKIKSKLINSVMRDLLGKDVFSCLLLHDLESDFALEDLHSTQHYRNIADKYFNIRLFSHAELYNEHILQKGNIGLRQQSNKLVQFKGL